MQNDVALKNAGEGEVKRGERKRERNKGKGKGGMEKDMKARVM